MVPSLMACESKEWPLPKEESMPVVSYGSRARAVFVGISWGACLAALPVLEKGSAAEDACRCHAAEMTSSPQETLCRETS